MQTISLHRDSTLGKHIEYIDKDEKTRIGKVTKITGNYLTVKKADGAKERVHPQRIHGVYYRKKLINIFFPKLGNSCEWARH